MIKLVLADIDDTLIPLGVDSISNRTIDAIHTIMDEGIYFGPATGRDLDGVEMFFKHEKECYSTGLVSNGKLVLFNNKIISTSYLDYDSIYQMYKVLNKEDDSFLILRVEGKDCILCLGNLEPNWESLTLSPDLKRLEDIPKGNILTATVVCCGDKKRATYIRNKMKEVAPKLECLASSDHIFDVVTKGWNKACAMDILLNKMGIDQSQVCFFGDSENDLAMMRAVDNSFAVGNAIDEVKNEARWVIGSVQDDAVSDVLLKIAYYQSNKIDVSKWEFN